MFLVELHLDINLTLKYLFQYELVFLWKIHAYYIGEKTLVYATTNYFKW